MNRPPILRLLRIAASAVCLFACLAFVVLKTRSYSRIDVLQAALTKTSMVQCVSTKGKLRISKFPRSDGAHWSARSLSESQLAASVNNHRVLSMKLQLLTLERKQWEGVWMPDLDERDRIDQQLAELRKQLTSLASDASVLSGMTIVPNKWGFHFRGKKKSVSLGCPHWYSIVFSGVLGAAPGIRTYRFTLRALLISMSVVAVILGEVVLAMR